MLYSFAVFPSLRLKASLRKQPTFLDATTGFPTNWRSDEWAQEFHTDDVILPRSVWCLCFVMARGKLASANQKHHLDQGGDTSSAVWNFYPHSHFCPQTSFCGETFVGVGKYQLFSQALRACLRGGGWPQVGDVTRLGGVTCLST